MKHSLAKKSFQCKRDWLCTVHEEVCMLCSRVHAMHAFGHAFPMVFLIMLHIYFFLFLYLDT